VTYGAAKATQAPFDTGVLPRGRHTVVVEVLDRRNILSTGASATIRSVQVGG